MPLTPELIARALAEIGKSAANCDYFLQRLSSPEWIHPLREHGLFDDPPGPRHDTQGIWVPSWLPSQYLARVAGRAPEEVVDLVLSIRTDNERIHEDAGGARRLPAMTSTKASGVTRRLQS